MPPGLPPRSVVQHAPTDPVVCRGVIWHQEKLPGAPNMRPMVDIPQGRPSDFTNF